MKKYLVVLNVALCFLVSCARETMDRQPVDGTLFYAGLESSDGKTFLSNHNIYWQSGDEIAVFGNGAKGKFTLVDGATTTNGTFSGNVGQADEYFAVYPYTESASVSSSTITTEIPQIQTFLRNSVGSGQNVAVAHSNNNTLSFKNVTSLLKIEISSPNIGQIIIKGNNDEYLSGKVNITFNDGVPECTCVAGQKSVVLKSVDKPFDPGIYYAAVLPQTFSKGINITLKAFEYQTNAVVKRVVKPVDIVKTSSNALVAARSSITPCGNLDGNSVWKFGSVKVDCLRDASNDNGQYIDFNTGRTFCAIGAYNYCEGIDLAFIKANTGGAGFCSIHNAETYSVTGYNNCQNLLRYGTPDVSKDNAQKWPVQNITKLCYLPGFTGYADITTASQLKDIFDSCGGTVEQYYSASNADGKNLNNTNISNGTQKYCVFKTGNPDEGTVIGLIEFNGVKGVTNEWRVEMNYKIAFVDGTSGPSPDPVQPVDTKVLVDPYGLNANPAAGDEKIYGQQITTNFREMGVRWLRASLNWGWMQTVKGGSWNFTFFDNNIRYCKADGINMLPILCYDQEKWARPLYNHINDWLDYVTTVVNRYKGYCNCWEVYNEPNHKNYWHGEDPNPAHYTELLKQTYKCIKSIDPTAAVIFGGIAGVGTGFVESCLKEGAGSYFDAMNFHPYNLQGKPEKVIDDINTMNALLAKYGCEKKPLWITEIGWPTPDPIGDYGVSQTTQAEYIVRVYMSSFAAGAGKTFWYLYRAPEDETPGDPEAYRHHYGIVHNDLMVKPANKALTVLVDKLPSGSTKPVMTVNGDNYVCHWQNPSGEDVWAFWNKNANTAATLSYTGTIKSAYDLYGNMIGLSAGSVQSKTACTYVIGPDSLTIN